MKQRSQNIIMVAAAAFVFPGSGMVLSASDQVWEGKCEITFSGTSTLHEFSGSVAAEPFTVTTSDLEDISKAKATGKVQVKVLKMDTANKKRDAKMHKAMNQPAYPTITVTVQDLQASATQPVTKGSGPRPTVIPFTMTLMGKKYEMSGKVADWSRSENEVSCQITFPVSLAKVGISPPSVLGLVKVADGIQVEANLSLRKQ